mgnify:CR=1 FL=1
MTDSDYTVIMPFFNEENTLEIAVTNLVNEDFASEIILVNDGSNDRYIIKNAPVPTGSSLECVSGKIVIPSGGSVKVKKDSGTADVIVSLLTDVS